MRRPQQQLSVTFADGAVFVPLEDVATLAQCGNRLWREIGNGSAPARQQMALCLSNVSSLCMLIQDDDAAQRYLHAALALGERNVPVSTRAFALANLSELAQKANDAPTARQHFERAMELAAAAGMQSLAGWLWVQLAQLAVRRCELDVARACGAKGSTMALSLQAQMLKAALLRGLAETLKAQGQANAARRSLTFAAYQPALSVPDRDELRAQ